MVVGRASSKYGEAEGVAAGSGCGRGLGCRGRAAEGVSALLASGGGEPRPAAGSNTPPPPVHSLAAPVSSPLLSSPPHPRPQAAGSHSTI